MTDIGPFSVPSVPVGNAVVELQSLELVDRLNQEIKQIEGELKGCRAAFAKSRNDARSFQTGGGGWFYRISAGEMSKKIRGLEEELKGLKDKKERLF